MPAPTAVVDRVERDLLVSLDQAQAAFADLYLLYKVDDLLGMDPWVAREAARMTAERRQLNHDLIQGFFFLFQPRQHYSSFKAFVDELERQDPAQWGPELLEAYRNLPWLEEVEPSPTDAELLADFDLYLEFLRARFDAENIDVNLERKAHRWLNDPLRLQHDVVEHFRFMWREHLEAGWNESLPLIEESVRSFREADWPEGDRAEIARWVTGNELHASICAKLDAADQVRFVPSAHIGPYQLDISGETTVWIVFGARQPEGSARESRALGRAEMLVRLNALADETRLRILELLQSQEEMCAQEIIETMGMSQSSASRHLRQLTATGYLLERRVESAKCYRLNREQLQTTLLALGRFFDVGQ